MWRMSKSKLSSRNILHFFLLKPLTESKSKTKPSLCLRTSVRGLSIEITGPWNVWLILSLKRRILKKYLDNSSSVPNPTVKKCQRPVESSSIFRKNSFSLKDCLLVKKHQLCYILTSALTNEPEHCIIKSILFIILFFIYQQYLKI